MRQVTSVSGAALITALLVGATPVAAQAQTASATDLDFVRRVHLTVMAVSPPSALARAVSGHAAVKTLAAQVGSQAAQLDSLARSTATALKVSLNSPLPAAQQTALAVLQGQTGAAFDTEYVNYLWAADSALLPIAMTVHATTGNTAVRRLAERADTVVAAQLPQLQKSGLLQMAILPTAAASTPARLPGGVLPNQRWEAQARSGAGFLSPPFPVRVIVLIAALGVTGALTWRLLAQPPRRRTRRRTRPSPATTTAPDPADARSSPGRR